VTENGFGGIRVPAVAFVEHEAGRHIPTRGARFTDLHQHALGRLAGMGEKRKNDGRKAAGACEQILRLI